MTTAATTLLGLALPVTGELSGTWGDTVNNSLTSLLDTAVAGTTTLSSDADVTLTTTTLASNQARQAVILWTAGGTATRTITAPAQSKTYIVINKTSSTQSIKIVGVGPTTGVTIVAGEKCLVVWNGVDFVKAGNTSGAGEFTTLGATGNVTLGDATTDTVTVNGYMGVGGAGNSSYAINITSASLVGGSQYGIVSAPTSTVAATSTTAAYFSFPKTAAAAYTATNVTGLFANDATKGAGSTITNQHGVYIANQTQGTNNYGITSLVSSGTDKWNIYASGTAQNYFAGNVGVGTSSQTSMLQTAGSSSVSAFKTPNIAEVDTIAATAATGTINYDITTQSVLFYTTNASGNWTVNFRGSSGTTLNTLMATGESISATFLVTQGATAYYNSAVTIDGTSVTPKWQGGTAPTSGNASAVDCYSYVIQKTGSATYVVLASVTKFA